ncbi:MAG: HNH endonuclease signature motif containing protein [bacterium]
MIKITVILLEILFFIFSLAGVEAEELCDCYGICTIIYPRNVNLNTKKSIKIRDGYTPNAKVDIDHKIPLCLGGANSIDNLQALVKDKHEIKTQHDVLLLYYVKNCLMTIEEAQQEALKWRK